jgi:hypothetical protein
MCALAAHRQATAAWLHGDILTAGGDTQHFLLDGLPLSRSEFQQVIFLCACAPLLLFAWPSWLTGDFLGI